ncbi:MAG: LPS assembly lipoprotein LptE [Terriglobia bacterium]
MRSRIQLVVALLLALAGFACGYRVAGRAGRLPENVKVIAVPAFENQSSVMGVEQRLTAAVMQEFIHRTRYRVVGKEEGADAVLRGTVKTVRSRPVIFDPVTGRASAIEITVTLGVQLRDRAKKETLFANQNYLFREQYEITSDLESFFEERNPAFDRLARDVAATLVSAILENF